MTARENDGLWLRCRNPEDPGDELRLRDQGFVRKNATLATLERIDNRDVRGLSQAPHDTEIRIPRVEGVGVGALVGRHETPLSESALPMRRASAAAPPPYADREDY